jgi:hypothetical protein
MPRGTKKLIPLDKPSTLKQREKDGLAAFAAWMGAKSGRGAWLAARTGMNVASISRMKSGLTRITMEAAILIELGTDRALKAEQLCPAQAMLIALFRGQEDVPEKLNGT